MLTLPPAFKMPLELLLDPIDLLQVVCRVSIAFSLCAAQARGASQTQENQQCFIPKGKFHKEAPTPAPCVKRNGKGG